MKPHQGNIDRFSGFADCYDSARPSPPPAAAEILIMMAKTPRPAMIVDLGSGTGLSTRIWGPLANHIIGIEPNADMRRQATLATAAQNIEYREGNSSQTCLPENCADIVTCSQSLHWMDPEPTFSEIRRILRPEGVFASIDCDWPPAIGWEIESAYLKFTEAIDALEIKHGIAAGIQRWKKDGHLTRIRQSGCFRYTRELLVHSLESGNAARLVMLACSQGSVASLLKLGLSENEIGLTALREAANRLIGDKPVPWYFSYRLRVGVK